jgi:hypothetical protein
VIDEAAGFFHRGIEAEVFVREPSVFVSLASLYTHDDFMGMNFFDRTLYASPIDVDSIAGF